MSDGAEGRRTVGGLVLTQATTALIGALVSVASARALGPDGRGELALAMQVAYIGSIVGLFGSERAMLVCSAECGPLEVMRLQELLLRAVAVALGVIAVAAAVVLGWSGYAPAIAIAAVVLAYGDLWTRSGRAAAAVLSSTAQLTRYTLTGNVLTIGAAAALYLTHVHSVWAWVACYALPLFGVGFLLWFHLADVAYRRTEVPGTMPTRVYAVRCAKLFPGSASLVIAMRFDRILVPLFAGAADLGRYVIVASLSEMLAWPLAAYADACLPRWRTRHLEGRLVIGRELAIVAAAGALGAVVFTVVVPRCLGPVFGARFSGAADLCAPLAFAAAALGLARVSSSLLAAQGRFRTVSAAEVTSAVTAMTAYLLLIPHFHAMGGAIGSLVGYSAAAVVGVSVLRRSPAGALAPAR